jgi:hypothetical protein
MLSCFTLGLSLRRFWPCERQSFRSLGTVNQPKRSRKPGRPKLPKGQAKGKIVPVRFAPEDIRAVEAAAKANNQTVSEWIRSTLNTAIKR